MMKKCLYAGMLSFLAMAPLSYAGDDSSSDVNGFGAALDKAPAVMLQVAIDANGNEDSTSANLRVYTGAPIGNESQVMSAFKSSVDASSQPQITDKDITADSSTWGFYRYRGATRWVNPYYYRNYYPTYYNRGVYYYYNYPSYNYTHWNSHYRYYYYPRRYR